MTGEAFHQAGCLICGSEISYSREDSERICAICGTTVSTNVACTAGHYVCDTCHCHSANDLIQRICVTSRSTSPLELASQLMHSPLVKMHGPEHHFLVPAVLLSAWSNLLGVPEEDKKRKIETARRRAEDVKGGACGFLGSCGAAVGTGIFVSLITNATPLSRSEWAMANLMTSESLKVIAEHGGPRCCKRDTFLAILAAASFLRTRMNLDLDVSAGARCTWTDRNRECLKKECPFFTGRVGS